MRFQVGDYVMVDQMGLLHMVGRVGVAAATILGSRSDENVVDIDLNIMGNHLPQMYRTSECTLLDLVNLEDHGFCPTCKGWGVLRLMENPTLDDMLEGAGIRCADCQGVGKIYMTIDVLKTDNETWADMQIDTRKVEQLKCEICRNAAPPA